jgi:hypothetical protein
MPEALIAAAAVARCSFRLTSSAGLFTMGAMADPQDEDGGDEDGIDVGCFGTAEEAAHAHERAVRRQQGQPPDGPSAWDWKKGKELPEWLIDHELLERSGDGLAAGLARSVALLKGISRSTCHTYFPICAVSVAVEDADWEQWRAIVVKIAELWSDAAREMDAIGTEGASYTFDVQSDADDARVVHLSLAMVTTYANQERIWPRWQAVSARWGDLLLDD